MALTPRAMLSDNHIDEEPPPVVEAFVYQKNIPVTPITLRTTGIGNGYCVDLVKYYRDIPWNGDAKYYYEQAIFHNFKVGSEPKVNAIFVKTSGQYGHVAFVTEVLKESFIVTEQNVLGRWIISERHIPIKNNQLFIY